MPTIDALPAVTVVADSDEFALSRGGTTMRATRGQLIASSQPLMALVPGQILGRQSAGVGAPEPLRLGAGFSVANGVLAVNTALPNDAVTPESFGAVGDGVTDDTAAFVNAAASGKPVRLGPKTYGISGQWTIANAGVVMIGVPGASTLRRIGQFGGAFIAVQADGFIADGIVFDANKAGVTAEAWNVLVSPAVRRVQFRNCRFLNAAGSSLGSGLTLQGGGILHEHVVANCDFASNTVHGLWVQAVSGVQVSGCRAQGNGAVGINIDFNDASFATQARLVEVTGCRAWNNQRGIDIGNFNVTNLTPPTWGNANPDAVGVLVSGNVCHENSVYGIAASGLALSITGNLLFNNGSAVTGGAGILANIGGSSVTSNMVTGSATYGIDCGGAQDSEVSFNQVQGGSVYGINCGGSTTLRVAFNRIQGCTLFALCVGNTEADGAGTPFPTPVANLVLADNTIEVPSGAGGIWLRDGASAMVLRNAFSGPIDPADALRADTDRFVVEGNRCNGAARITCNPVAGTLVVPDIAESVFITTASAPVTSILGASASRAAGAVRMVRITACGSGYTHATLAIGGAGSGAAAQAVIVGGAVIGAIISNGGTGYGAPGQSILVAVTGDGNGAQALAFAGAAQPEERRLLIRCDTAASFTVTGSQPPQENWTFATLDVPSKGDVEFVVTWGAWRARGFALADWLGTDGEGGAVVKSLPGANVTLHPSGSGQVRIGSDLSPAGVVFAIGNGSPQGGVAAPPGSDYRNLLGGVGQTVWVKQTGNDAYGWVAIA